MNPSGILFLGKDTSPIELIHTAVAGSGVGIWHDSDWFSALQISLSRPPLAVLIGPDIPAPDIRLLMGRMKSFDALKEVPMVLLVATAHREIILEFINIGIRSYVVIPCKIEILKKRLACHIPALSSNAAGEPQLPSKSVGARLRQRMERKMSQELQESLRSPASAPTFPNILLIEQTFTDNFGLTVRESERHVSLYEKIDSLKLRLGGASSHVVGIFIQLLSIGKVRIGFREKTERLSLTDPSMIMTRDNAVALIDSYLALSEKDEANSEPSALTCRLIVR